MSRVGDLDRAPRQDRTRAVALKQGLEKCALETAVSGPHELGYPLVLARQTLHLGEWCRAQGREVPDVELVAEASRCDRPGVDVSSSTDEGVVRVQDGGEEAAVDIVEAGTLFAEPTLGYKRTRQQPEPARVVIDGSLRPADRAMEQPPVARGDVLE